MMTIGFTFDGLAEVYYTNNLKHGRWNEADDGDGVVCSVCGADFCTMINDTERFNYCPNCGAKMDGERWLTTDLYGMG